MNTFREVQALILGYAGSNEEIRKRMLELVPDLADLVADVPAPVGAQRYLLKATDGNDRIVMEREVVARPEDLHAHVASLVAALPYTSGVSVVPTRL